MKINVMDFSGKPHKHPITESAVIVIDVFRCTTSIITAFMNGALKVIPAVEPGDAVAYASRIGNGSCVLGGERGGIRMPGFDLGNSPLEYSKKNVEGKTVIISTTNGTNAVCGVGNAGRVFIGAMINCSAAAKSAAAFSDDILIVCSGNKGSVAAEDWYAAGAVIQKLQQSAAEAELSDTAKICKQLYTDILNGIFDLSGTLHYRELIKLGFSGDVEYCLKKDITHCVPVYENGILKCAKDECFT